MLTTIRVANIPTGATTTIVDRIQRLTKETMCSRRSDTVRGQRSPCGCELARQKGTGKPNQWLKPLHSKPALKLAAVGCCGAWSSVVGGGQLVRVLVRRAGEAGWRVAVLFGDAAGVKLGADPAERWLVNVGSAPAVPAEPLGSGQAHRPLSPPGRGGGTVVLGAGESPVHGEGSQPVRGTTGSKEVAGEHRRAAGRSRRGRAAGTSFSAQAARVGIE